MKRLFACLALLSIAALVPAMPAPAQTLDPTAAELVELCESDVLQAGDPCGELLSDLVQIYVLIGTKDERRRVVCPPRMMAAEQMRDVFLAWATSRGDLATMSIGEAAERAIRERFPCTDIRVPPRR